jgi:hypothetical protein
MRHAICSFNLRAAGSQACHRRRIGFRDTLTAAVRRVIALVLAGALVAGCSRLGDDRFTKLPDAAVPDALDVTPDAGGPADAAGGEDAGVDATPDAS